MAELTKEARVQLGLVHKHDIIRVLAQADLIYDQYDDLEIFNKEISKDEFQNMLVTLSKYRKILDEIEFI